MTKKTKTAFMGGASFAPYGGADMMLRGPTICYDPRDPNAEDDDEDPPGDPPADPPPAGTVAKTVFDTLSAAHERLKKDDQKRKRKITELEGRIAELETELEEARTAGGDTNVIATKLAEQRTQLNTANDAKVRLKDDEIARLKRQLEGRDKDSAISTAMDDVRVKPEYRKAVRAMHRDEIKVEYDPDEEDAPPIVTMNGLPIKEAMTQWAATDEGKAFVSDGNSGGGSEGGSRRGASKNPWKAGTDFNMTEQGRIEVQDPARAARLKAEAGVAP